MTDPLVNQPTSAPTRKVVAATVGAGPIAGIVVFAYEFIQRNWVPDLPELEEGAALFIAMVITAIAGYFTRNRASNTSTAPLTGNTRYGG